MTPERFVRGVPKPLALPQAVWINQPKARCLAPACSYTEDTERIGCLSL